VQTELSVRSALLASTAPADRGPARHAWGLAHRDDALQPVRCVHQGGMTLETEMIASHVMALSCAVENRQ